MNKIGIKITNALNYEQFESFQYLLEYDFEYEDMEEHIENKKIVELDIDDEKEDRAEDIEALHSLLLVFDRDEIDYELYILKEEWMAIELNEIT